MLRNLQFPNSHRTWTKRYTLFVIAFSFGVFFLYAMISPGIDYYGAYTWMVTSPEKLPLVAEQTWTLNPPWLVPFMAPFVTLPGNAGLITFMAAMIIMTVVGCYMFGGRPILTLLSAQMWWVLWWGQLEGWGIFALVLGWVAVLRKSWLIMFLSLAIASFKPQVGFIPVIALWWWIGSGRWKSFVAMVLLLIVSILIWGPWPIWYYQGITSFVGDLHYGPWNSSLGYIAIPLLIPALLLPLNREKRLIALTATTLLFSPYLPFYSTILLLCFNIPTWMYIFGFIGYLPAFFDTTLPWNFIAFLPISVLLWLYWPFIIKLLHLMMLFTKRAAIVKNK